MDAWVAFVAGVIVGMAAIVGAQRIRGGSAGTAPTLSVPAASSFPSGPPGSTRVTSSSVRLEGDKVSIDVDGRTYHRLHDVPEADRDLLVKELQAVVNSDAPESLRSQIRAFLAGSDHGAKV
jgi:hypothetical protein